MSEIQEIERGSPLHSFAVLRQHFGFLPRLYRCQNLHPQLLEIEACLTTCLFSPDTELTRVQKDLVMLAVSAAVRNVYCVTLQSQTLSLLGVAEEQREQIICSYPNANVSPADQALLDLAVKLGIDARHRVRGDVSKCIAQGWSNQALLEAAGIAAWSKFLCTLSWGLGVVPDFEPIQIPVAVPLDFSENTDLFEGDRRSGPHFGSENSAVYPSRLSADVRLLFSFVPAIFQAQVSWPDLISAEASALEQILFVDSALSRTQKQLIAFIASVAAGRRYWVEALSRVLTELGFAMDQLEQIARDFEASALPQADRTLLGIALKLALQPLHFGPEDSATLRGQGFSDEQIVEAIAAVSLACFLWTLQSGFGIEDNASGQTFSSVRSKTLHFFPGDSRPTQQSSSYDPDLESVLKIQAGNVNAFEDLMLRHHRRVYRILVGILGNRDEARDGMQETFLKAFQHLETFERRAKFSTWLTSIASNTGMQILRERKGGSSLEGEGDLESGEDSRPRQLRAWVDDPEQSCSKAELRDLVEQSVMRLPVKYRTVLLLRDLEQLPMEEAAACLALTLPAFKARLLRGRLMLREALAPHFAARTSRGIA